MDLESDLQKETLKERDENIWCLARSYDDMLEKIEDLRFDHDEDGALEKLKVGVSKLVEAKKRYGENSIVAKHYRELKKIAKHKIKELDYYEVFFEDQVEEISF